MFGVHTSCFKLVDMLGNHAKQTAVTSHVQHVFAAEHLLGYCITLSGIVQGTCVDSNVCIANESRSCLAPSRNTDLRAPFKHTRTHIGKPVGTTKDACVHISASESRTPSGTTLKPWYHSSRTLKVVVGTPTWF